MKTRKLGARCTHLAGASRSEVAAAGISLVSDAAGIITGSTIDDVNGGLH
jgi:hypothetical protein